MAGVGFDRTRRLLRPEKMDQFHMPLSELRSCLRDLGRLNRLTGGDVPVLQWLHRIAPDLPRDRDIHVLDLACGQGDTLRRVARWARRRGIGMRLIGVDLNPQSIALAQRFRSALPIEYQVGDVLTFDISTDLVMTSLFLHHLNDDQAIGFLRKLDQGARLGWLVNDLHRHAVSYWGLRVGTAMLRLHDVVRFDGPVSVAQGFTAAELWRLIDRAGLSRRQAALRWHVPFRWSLSGRS